MKVICTGYNRIERYFIKGKTYNVENGKITNENGYTYEDVTNEKVLKYLSEWYKFEEVKNDCIVIYRKDNETIALDKTTGAKAVAKCSPEDKYDFTTGAKLAFERLTGTEKKEPEKKLYNGKVVCVDLCGVNGEVYTVGKVYQFENGFTRSDQGITLPSKHIQIYNFEDWQKWASSKFIEIKE